MAALLAIIHFPEGWRIMLDGQKRGLFNFQIDATEAALRLAADIRRAGKSVEILVQNKVGELVRLAQPEPPPVPG